VSKERVGLGENITSEQDFVERFYHTVKSI